VRKAELTFIDADGHVLEHPTAMQNYAPEEYRDRIWHIETAPDGTEYGVYNGQRSVSNFLATSGTAGDADMLERARKGELRYTEVRPAAYNAKPRLDDMTEDGIAQSVLYPTILLGVQGTRDAEFAEIQCQAYNNWLVDHVAEGEGRLFGAAVIPQQDIERAAREIRRVAKLPGIVGVFIRPNPTADWKPFNHPVYDPLWAAASESGLPLGLHPFLAADLPGTCQGLRLAPPTDEGVPTGVPMSDDSAEPTPEYGQSIAFTQAISNPFDIMSSMAYVLMGGVCERFPDLRLIFLEANGGWLVSWLERLDHHAKVFNWELPSLKRPPSDYFRRQCWISFDPDESTLAFSANSPLVGSDRIIWASDYPHPDAKFPGVTDELFHAVEGLGDDQQRQIAGQNAKDLYGL